MPRAALAYEHWEREQAGEAEKILINMYAEVDRSNPKRDARLVTTPGTRDRDPANVITGTIRAIAQSDAFADGKVLILDGTTLRTWAPSTGTFGTISGTVSGTDRADVAFTQTELAILSAGTLYVSGGSSIAAETDADFPSNITSIAASSQRILFTYGQGRFGYTEVLDVDNYDALSFYTAEASPDNLVAVRTWGETILLFGSETVEMWYAEPSNADDPFSRGSSVIPVGCFCRDGIAITDKGPFWVAPDLTVRAMAGAEGLVVSPPWVTRMLRGVSASDVMAAWYSAEGQTFYCLNVPDFCAVMDVGSGQWHLRETTEIIEGVVATTLAVPTLAATGKLLLQAVLAATTPVATLVSTATIASKTGVLELTLTAPALAATGTVKIQGALTVTLANATLASTGEMEQLPGSGLVAQTLDAPTLSATGQVKIAGTLSSTLANATLVSTATIVDAYSAEALALFAEMDSEPDETRKEAIDTFIESLKSAGIWSKLDVLWVMRAHDAQAARLNWKSPTTFALTAVNSPTFTTNRGYAGDGSTSHLTTGWIPSTHGSQLTQNSASVGAYVSAGDTTASVNAYMLGAEDGSNNRLTLRPRRNSDFFGAHLNSGSNSDFNTQTTRLAFWIARRDSASSTRGYRNGTSEGSDTDASTGRPTVEMFICAVNDNGARIGNANNTIGLVFAGASLDNTDAANFNTALDTYITATT